MPRFIPGAAGLAAVLATSVYYLRPINPPMSSEEQASLQRLDQRLSQMQQCLQAAHRC